MTLSPADITNDPLIVCLSYITGMFGRTKSPSSLMAGLEWSGKASPIPLFIEASSRAGIKAAHFPAPSVYTTGLMPCVAVGDSAAIVVRFIHPDGDTAQIWDPVTHKESEILVSELARVYDVAVLTVEPSSAFIDPVLKEATSNGQSHWFWSIIRRDFPVYSKVLTASFLINVLALAAPIFVMNMFDRVIPAHAIQTGWAFAIGMVVIFGFDFLIRTIRGIFVDFAARHIDVQVARALFDQVLDMKMAHRPLSSGGFANMLRDFEGVRDFFTSAMLTIFFDLPFALLFIGLIFYLGGVVGVWIILLMLISLSASFLIQIPLKHYVRKALKTAETKHGLLMEVLLGLETIKTMVADGKVRARYTAHIAENAAATQSSRYYSALGVSTSGFIQQLGLVLIMVAGMYLTKSGMLSTGSLIACMMLCAYALSAVTRATSVMSRYQQSIGTLRTLDKIMHFPKEHPEPQEFLYRGDVQGDITLRNVSFAYPHSDHTILHDIHLHIARGERVGIIGRNGSGKSTLAKLMLKLYDPATGRILMDGTDYTHIDPADLRRAFAYISQDITLFAGTIRDNITIARPNASEGEIVAAATAAGAHDFITAHPLGYDAPVLERGDGLSGGQKQCIALARALLLNPPVFICDEPTNAMDMQAEDNFARLIDHECKNRTLILITNRPNLLPLVNRLIIIDGGKIVMDGPRDQVLSDISRPQPTSRGGHV